MSYFTPEMVANMRTLLAHPRLGAHLADVVIASAYLTGQTPLELIKQLHDGYLISDEQWRTLVEPELAYALGEGGPR